MIDEADGLGAFCRHDGIRVAGAATGPLSGRRFAAKDVLDVEGHTCCAGNPDWLASHEPAEAISAAIRRLLDGGATLTAKAERRGLGVSSWLVMLGLAAPDAPKE